ncbi:MAG: hypothetical protein ACLTQI_04205 [Slackia sp.]
MLWPYAEDINSGHHYAMDDVVVDGLGIVDRRLCEAGAVDGNAVVQSGLLTFRDRLRNHGGRTTLHQRCPFGQVLARTRGNNGEDGGEGVHQGNLIGTYLHGPLLPKNPQVADHLISRALERRGDSAELAPLDDAVELEANRIMLHRLGVF